MKKLKLSRVLRRIEEIRALRAANSTQLAHAAHVLELDLYAQLQAADVSETTVRYCLELAATTTNEVH